MSIEKKSILKRFYWIGALMTLFFGAILYQIIEIQFFEVKKYTDISMEANLKQDTIYANKGNVYAADGNLLATSMAKFTIRMDAVAVNNTVFEKNVGALSRELSKMLGKSPSYYLSKLKFAKKTHNRYLLIARNVGYLDYLKMKTFPIFNLGVYKGGFIAAQRTVRLHPIGKIAERTIGYDDFRGESGIEGAFADYMEGKNGIRWKRRMAKNQWKPISDDNEKEPIDGDDIITTLDINIQDITHHALLRQLENFEAEHGSAVVMETKTGEIKAIANLGRTSKGKYYEKRNYAVWESHEPGSTFKLASLMIALEDKMIDTSTVVDTEKGIIYFHGAKIEDSKRGGHGKISAARVLEVSSNVGIAKLISAHYHQNPQKFYNKLVDYGFTKPIGFPIRGEGKPYIPNPNNRNEWNNITLEWMAWGYGISVTPMQTLMFYNAVANNGVMVKPRFVKELKRQNKTEKIFNPVVINPKIASEETLKKVRKILKNVVIKGTAQNIYSPNFSMAGKTGTAKKYVAAHTDKKGNRISGQYSNKRYVASFVGFFPAENPKYSCIVVVHDPVKKKGYYGAKVAAPVFKEIAQKIYTSTPINQKKIADFKTPASVENDYNHYDKLLLNNNNLIPNVLKMSGMDAVSLLENLGLKVRVSGIGKVASQSIKSGTKIIKGKTITLKLK